MLRIPLTAMARSSRCARLAFAALIAMAFCLVHPASTAYAGKEKRKRAPYGTIKLLTTPGGFPIAIDGKPRGETSSEYREFQLDPGLHTVVISLPNGQKWSREIKVDGGRVKCVALNYRPPVTQPKSPCPYPVNVSAPASVNEGDVITFTADAAYSGNAALNYTWTISPGDAKIVSGAGTPTISVDSTGFGGRKITAILVVDDGSGDSACRQASQASTMVPPPPPRRENPAREFDVCYSCSYDDQKARLDNLAIAMANDPSVTTYIISYSGRASHAGQAERLLIRARDYLTKQRSVDQARIATMNGGFREEDCVELWIVPSGAQPPQPTPTGETRPAAEKPATRKRRG